MAEVLVTCRDCHTPVVDGARWCAACGAAAPTPAPEPEVVEEARARRSIRLPRPSRRTTTAVLTIALITGLAVLLRPAPPPLDRVDPGVATTAGGRDAARTGRVPGLVLAAGLQQVSETRVPVRPRGSVPEIQLYEEAVVVVEGDRHATALDRRDGSVLWTSPSWQGWPRSGGHAFMEDGLSTLHAIDVVTGERVWSEPRGAVLGADEDVAVIATEDGGAGGRRVVDGAWLWHRPDLDGRTDMYEVSARDGIGLFEVFGEATLGPSGASPSSFSDGRGSFALLDYRTGDVTPLDLDLGASSVTVVGGGRVLAAEHGQVFLLKAADGWRRQPWETAPLGRVSDVQAAGDVVIVRGDVSGDVVLDRDTLEVRFTIEAGRWVSVADGALIAERWDDPRFAGVIEVLDPSTGDVVGQWAMDDGRGEEPFDGRPMWDGAGVVEFNGFHLRHHPFDGKGRSWSASLAPDDLDLHTFAGGDEVVLWRDVELLSVLPGLPDESVVTWRASRRGGVRSEEVVAAQGPWTYRGAGSVLFATMGPTAAWSTDLEGDVTGLALRGDRAWVATDRELATVDLVDGTVLRSIPAARSGWLSVGGDEVVVLTTPDGGVSAHDPESLRERWASDFAACGPASLVGRLAAVPIEDGLVLLDIATGRTEASIELPGSTPCLGLTVTDSQVMAVGPSTLHRFDVVTSDVVVDRFEDPILGPPLVADDGILVTTTHGLEFVGADGERWSLALHARPLSAAVSHDGGVAVVIADGRLLHLRGVPA